MLRIPQSVQAEFSRPVIIFTIKGHKASEAVVKKLIEQQAQRSAESLYGDVSYAIFEDYAEADAAIHDKTASVALCDGSLQYSKRFTPLVASRQFDKPLCGAQWGYRLTPKVLAAANGVQGCANQIYADMVRNFNDNLSEGKFPWGLPRQGEDRPSAVKLPEYMAELVRRLNSGPDLARSIAAEKFALELPTDSKISWIRILPAALIADAGKLTAVMDAFSQFEVASSQLCAMDTDVQELLLAGVALPPDSPVRNCYLFPRAEQFSLRRPDLHLTSTGLFASENDEMPGGLPELFHLDNVYGTNQESWQEAIDWLTAEGPLVFVVSTDWSSVYIEDTSWFVKELVARGYDARMVTTAELDRFDIRPDGVYLDGDRVGTLWRQFPIFETEGKLAKLVVAAHKGIVRMIPEFAHWGNKSWFSIFRSREDFYREALDPATFAILDEILPDSCLVRSSADFPVSISTAAGRYEINSLKELKRLPADARNLFVLKVTGANDKAARMYGVFMGNNLSDEVWSEWIEERFRLDQPFLIQTRFHTAVLRVPVLNTKRGCPELFSSRIMIRPYMLNGRIVSASATVVPSYTERVHGMIDMALGPVVLEE